LPRRWAPRLRATRPISVRCRRARDGGARTPERSRPGPTTIPTSSARSCARSWRVDPSAIRRKLKQKIERLDHGQPADFRAPDIPVALLAVDQPAVARRGGEVDKSDRLIRGAAARSRDTGDRDGGIDA